MASHKRREPSSVQSINIRGQELIAAFWALVQSITSAGSYKDAAWPLRRIFGVNALRASRNLSSWDAFRDSKPTTGEAVRSVCDKRGLALHPHVVTCEQGPSAMLHETPSAQHPRERVFLYFHGGGYWNPLSPLAHMPVILECSEALRVGRTFILEYGLAPGLQYPGQLYQAACALNLLLGKLDCQLGDIVIGGDSAGGNLVLALIAHMKQPHPLVPAVRSLAGDSKLRGAVLISPWVSQTNTATSYAENSARDYLTREAMAFFTQQWAPKDEFWADFFKAPTDFWKDIPVKKTLVTVGGFEVFRDDVQEMAKLMDATADKSSAAVSFVEAPAEVHVHSGVDSALGLPFCKSFLEILLWCRDLS